MNSLSDKKHIGRLLSVIVSIVVALVSAEILFRICIYFNLIRYPKPDYSGNVHKYSENKELVYELKSSFFSDRGEYITNKYGMRDFDYSLKKSSNTIRICVLGDSVTYGVEVELKQTFENILEEKLNNNLEKKFEVLNFSVNGYNASQEEIVLEDKVIKFSPDIVIVGFCLNDDSPADGLGELTREMSPNSTGSRLHSKLLSFLLHRKERLLFNKHKNMNRVDGFFEKLAVLSRTNDFDTLILLFPYYFKTLATYDELKRHEIVNEFAKKHKINIFDFKDSWKGMHWEKRKKLYVENDYIHFSAVGMNAIADEIYDLIKNTKWDQILNSGIMR